MMTDPIHGAGSTGIWGDNVKYREMNKGIAYVWNWILRKNYVWLDPSVRVRRQPKVIRCSRRHRCDCVRRLKPRMLDLEKLDDVCCI